MRNFPHQSGQRANLSGVRFLVVCFTLIFFFLSLAAFDLIATTTLAAAAEALNLPVEQHRDGMTRWWEPPRGSGSGLPVDVQPQDLQIETNVNDLVRLAFQKERLDDAGGSHWDIFFSRPLSTPVQLTHGPSNNIYPRLDPTLSRVVFASDRDGDYELYSMDVEGPALLQLTNNDWIDSLPVWSPDGSQIAYVASPNGNADIFVMQADGTGVVPLTSGPMDDLYPAWSPDGAQLAWVQRAGTIGSVWLMNADGSNMRPLLGPFAMFQHLAWSPDGALIALSFDATGDGFIDVGVIRPDGAQFQLLLTSPNGQKDYLVSSWYPSRLSNNYQATNEPEIKRLLITEIRQVPNGDGSTRTVIDTGLLERCCAYQSFSIGHESGDAFADAKWADTQPPAALLQPLPEFSRATGFLLRWDVMDRGDSGVAGVIVETRNKQGFWWRYGDYNAFSPPMLDNYPGQVAAYRTQAYDHAGNFEPWSANDPAEAQTLSYRWQLYGTVTDNRGVARPEYPVVVSPAPLNVPQTGLDGRFLAYLVEDGVYTIGVDKPITQTVAADEERPFYLRPADAIEFDDITLGEPCVGLCLADLDEVEMTWEPSNFTSMVDASGAVHTAWKLYGGANRLYYQQRTPDGVWGQVEWVASFEISPDQANLAVGSDGAVHLTWSETTGLHSGFSERRSFHAERIPGRGWSAPELVGKGDTPQIAVGPDGRIHLVFLCLESPCGGGELQYRQRGTDGVWSEPYVVVWPYTGHQRVLHVKPDGAVLLAWSIGASFAIRQRDRRGQWGPTEWSPFQEAAMQTGLAFDSSGRLHAIWGQSNQYVLDQMGYDLYTTSWARWDGQGHWSTPLQLDQRVEPLPLLGSNSTGAVFLFNGGGDPRFGGVQYRFVTGKNRWSAFAPMTAGGQNFSVISHQFDRQGRGHTMLLLPDYSIAYLPPKTASNERRWEITRTLTLPAAMHRPTLSFFYQLAGGGAGPASSFQVGVATVTISDTITPTIVFSDTGQTVHQLGWVDLASWAGQSITLTFAVQQAADEPFLKAEADTISIGSWTTPVVEDVTPNRIDAGEITTIQVVGDNFIDVPQVRIGGTVIEAVRLLDERTLEVDVPGTLPPGRHSVRLTNPDGATSARIGALVVGKELYLPLVAR